MSFGQINKRLHREIRTILLQQNSGDMYTKDFWIHVDETDANIVHALIKAPADSVYQHKFIRLDLKFPENYPFSPPEVTFVNHDSVRIHPNMYENGKCCATILNTWGDSQLEKWTSSMGIETVLVMFHSFLDNHPYTYEPGGHDNPSYTVYVLYQSWYTCLIRYLQYETIPLFTHIMHQYMFSNIEAIFETLGQCEKTYPYGMYNTRTFEIDDYTINYARINATLQQLYNYLDYVELTGHEEIDTNFNDFLNKDYGCNICFDTSENEHQLRLHCSHSFHVACLREHVANNGFLCSMCRREIPQQEQEQIMANEIRSSSEWVINPRTKRRVKVGSRTYQYLQSEGVFE